MKLIAYSDHRFNGGIAAKRAYGSSTVTVFVVFLDPPPGGQSLYVESYGKTAPERKANALRVAMLYFEGKIPFPE